MRHCIATIAARGAAPKPRRKGRRPDASSAGADVTPTESPWGWLKMPKITMPKIEMPKMPADPLAPIKASGRKVGDGANKAWEGAKEMLTLGGSKNQQPEARVATSGEAPSMWQRMFGKSEPKQPEGPATVAEWMAQKRLDP